MPRTSVQSTPSTSHFRQSRNEITLAKIRSEIQCGFIVRVLDVRVGTLLHEELRDLRASLPHCVVKRRITFLVLGVDEGSAREEELDELLRARDDGGVERSRTVEGGHVGLGAVLEKNVDD